MPKKVYVSHQEVEQVMKESGINPSELQQSSASIQSPKQQRSPMRDRLKALLIALRGKILLLLLLTLVASLAFIGGIYYIVFYQQNSKATEITQDKYILVTKATNNVPVIVVSPQAPKTNENPINGVLYTKSEYSEFAKKPIIALMVENHPGARPQSSLNKADIVYETLVEGGITRYMGIFWSRNNDIKEFGPIRSARQYYLEWLSPYDPIYGHIGCAWSENPKIGACQNINNYGLKSIGNLAFFWRDNHRVAPHNAYSSPSLVYSTVKAIRPNWYKTPSLTKIKVWQFKNDEPALSRGDKTTAKITFFNRLNNGGLYDVQWKYNKSANKYQRYLAGQRDKDRISSANIEAKVVIILKTNIKSVYDDKGHMQVDTIGSGKATILQDGKAIEANWSKKDRNSRTLFYSRDNPQEKISFNRGLIWFTAVSTSLGGVVVK